MDAVDRLREGRGPGGQADRLKVSEPVGLELEGILHVNDGLVFLVASSNQLSCIVRVAPADDNDGVDSLQQLFEGSLAFWSANKPCQ